MKKKILAILLISILLILSFVYWRISTQNLYNLTEPPFFLDSGSFNVLNQDNEIFKTGRSFVYQVSFFDSTNTRYFMCLEPKLDGPSSRLMTFKKKYCIDKVNLMVYKNKGETSLGDTQTIIKYDYYDANDRVFYGEKTGVIEDSSRIFLHPPRIHFFSYNQLNPFPYIKFPLEKNKYWELEFGIPQHTLEKIPWLNNSSLRINYSFVSKDIYSGPMDIDSVYKYEAFGINEQIKTRSVFYFNEKLGFVRMEFLTVEGIKIEMVLDKIVEESESTR